MRKVGLLDKKPLTATRKMLETAAEDKGTVKKAVRMYSGDYSYTEYESRFYFRAALSDDKEILEVDLFTRRDLAHGRKEPKFRIFLDRRNEDFISWDVAGEKWRRAKIDMLPTGDDRCGYSYRGRNHAAKETLNTVNRYLGTGKMQDVETAVIDFQAKIRGAELARKHRLATDIIDGYMDTVPDRLPSDWMKFINDRALEHSIFYLKEKRTGYCTHCRLHVPIPPDVRHNMTGKCISCGSSATYKSWKMQKHITFRTAVSLLQKCTDGENYVCRQFRVGMYTERSMDYVPEIAVHEDYRQIFRIGETNGRIENAGGYEWGVFLHTGIERWCRAGTVSHGGNYGCVSYGYSKSVLYTGNIKKLLKDTGLKYVPAADIIKSMGCTRISVTAVLGDMGMSFPYEAFWKMGLRQFVRDRVKNSGTDGLTRIEHHTQKPWQCLKITKECMKQAVRLDASDQQLRIIQKASGLGVHLADEDVLWLDRHMGVSVLMDYFNVQTPHRIIRYLKEKTGVEICGSGSSNTLLHLWTDYLDTARQMAWNLRDRQVFFPQDIQRAHDEAVNVFTLLKDKADAEEMKRTDIIMNRNAREIKKAFCYRDENFMITVPGRYLDFKHEGHMQHNCVATYYERAVNGECIILFIRRRAAPKESFCTVEVRSRDGRFSINQNRAAYNKPAPEDAEIFMKKALAAAQKIADGIRRGHEDAEICIRTAV